MSITSTDHLFLSLFPHLWRSHLLSVYPFLFRGRLVRSVMPALVWSISKTLWKKLADSQQKRYL
jgi:hypothetical protein